MCHRVASSTYSGYCNEVHYERGKLDELKEAYEAQLKKVKALEVKAHSTSCETGSELK